MRNNSILGKTLAKIVPLACLLGLCLSSTACGSTSDKSASENKGMTASQERLEGVSAKGELGKKPTISFRKPLNFTNNSYAVVQQGKGASIKIGDQVCSQAIALDSKTGKVLMDTWEKNTPTCDVIISKTGDQTIGDKIFKGQRLNSTIAIGVKNSKNTASKSYIMVYTLISKKKALTRATGDKVTDIPDNLPKISLDKTGKPSLDPNGYKPDGTLIAQPLIKGKGAAVKESDTVTANYTGWYVDSKGAPKQFDSSWDRKQSSGFALNQVITGWKNGLTGQTIGSQVLLIIPPDQGYPDGQKDQSGKEVIPANMTLYFVVDILSVS